MKSPEEYIKQYAPLKMYGTEYLHKDTVLKIIEEAQKDARGEILKSNKSCDKS